MSNPPPPLPPAPAPPPLSGTVATLSSGVALTRTSVRQLWRDILEGLASYFRHDIKRVAVLSIIGFAIGWGINAALIAFAYNGATPVGAPATADSNIVLGSVFWLVASTIFFTLIGFRLEVGRQEFWTDVREFPRTLRISFSTLGAVSVAVLLWGFAGAMLIELAIQPAVTAALAVGIVLAATARVLRPIVSEMFMVVWRSVVKALSAHRPAPPAAIVVTVGMIGGVAAALVGIFAEDLLIRGVLIGSAVLVAVLLGLRKIPSSPVTGMLLLVVGGVGIAGLAALLPGAVSASGGGFAACDSCMGSTAATSGGVVAYSAIGGVMAAVGAAVGGGLGSVLATGAGGRGGGTPDKPRSPAPGSPVGPAGGVRASRPAPPPPTAATGEVTVTGPEAVDLISKAGGRQITLEGQTGVVAPDWPRGLAFTPLTRADGQALIDPTTGRLIIDQSKPLAVVTSKPAPGHQVVRLTGHQAIQALIDSGFPTARDAKTGEQLIDPASGKPLLRADSGLMHGVSAMAFSEKTVNGQQVMDPAAPIVVTQRTAEPT